VAADDLFPTIWASRIMPVEVWKALQTVPDHYAKKRHFEIRSRRATRWTRNGNVVFTTSSFVTVYYNASLTEQTESQLIE